MNINTCRVAPFAGAWIEIAVVFGKIFLHMSLPSRERGLKFFRALASRFRFCVAPFAGAWIEISQNINMDSDEFVAPFAGAWIEISLYTYYIIL